MAKNVKVKIPNDLGGGEMNISSKDLTPEMEDVLKGGAGDTGVPDDEPAEAVEPVVPEDTPSQIERRQAALDILRPDRKGAAERRGEGDGEAQQESKSPQTREERRTEALDILRPDRKGAAERRGEGEGESQAGEEQSGQGQEEGNAELAEGTNAIIGELAQILQAVNGVTAAIREGIKVKL